MSTTDTQRIFLPFPATRSKHNFNIRHLIALSSFRQISSSQRCASSGCAFWQASTARLLLSSFKHRCVNSRSPAPQLFVFQRLRQGQCVLDFFTSSLDNGVAVCGRATSGTSTPATTDRHTGSRYGYDGVFPRHGAAAASYLLYWLASPAHREHPAGRILASC